jgi:hypothetical protein
MRRTLLFSPSEPTVTFMTFDDQLKRAVETLTERLRAEIDRQVQLVAVELSAAAQAERDLAAAEARHVASRDASGDLEIVVAAARQEAHDEGLAAGRAHGHREGLDEGLLQGIATGREQAERDARDAIDAAREAGRADAPADTGATERLADGVRAIGRGRSLTEVLDTLVHCAGQEAARAGVWLVRGATLRHWRSTGFEAPHADVPLKASTALAEAARSNAAVSDDDGFAVPITMNGDVVAVLYATNPESRIPNPDAIDVLTRYAARCLEAITAFKAARALTERPGAPGAEVAAADEEANAEEDASARRYARLLVSEIKLYHEAAVVEGRRDRDLASRLGGEIARARVLYEQRVPPQVRQRADYFHDELVRTLANGDATLLQLT